MSTGQFYLLHNWHCGEHPHHDLIGPFPEQADADGYADLLKANAESNNTHSIAGFSVSDPTEYRQIMELAPQNTPASRWMVFVDTQQPHAFGPFSDQREAHQAAYRYNIEMRSAHGIEHTARVLTVTEYTRLISEGK